MPRRVRVQA